MSGDSFDDFFFHILSNEGNIVGFFDKVFDFLYRRTDYFKIKRDASSELGLIAGEAENIVKSVFCKYMKQAVEEQRPTTKHVVNPFPADYVQEETVETSAFNLDSLPPHKEIDATTNNEKTKPDDMETKIPLMDPDCYNGARLETYSWAQTLRDIDIRLKVHPNTTSGKQVRVDFSQCGLKTEVLEDDNWKVLKEGHFSFKVNVEESTWTLVPGEYVHVCLQKFQERWWDSAFVGDPKIDLTVIDSSISYEDLDRDSQNKIEELMYNEHLKRTGQPTVQQSKIHDALKEAWNSDGSPFKGLPFDPSILDVSPSDSMQF